MQTKLKSIINIAIVITVFIVFIYGMYWIAKTVSYSLFYRGMVEQTVIEMVKPGSLK